MKNSRWTPKQFPTNLGCQLSVGIPIFDPFVKLLKILFNFMCASALLTFRLISLGSPAAALDEEFLLIFLATTEGLFNS